MNIEHQEGAANTEAPRWPTCSMLFWGTFGTKTAAERRYVMRSCFGAAAVAALVLLVFDNHFPPRPVMMRVILLAIGSLITFIAWELRRYLLTLDEFARRMQLEAMAWTYLTGFVVAGWLGVLAPFSHFLMRWPYKPALLLIIPFLYFFLEPVRAGWLYYLSRRY